MKIRCPNCETKFVGNFCPECGQSVTDFGKPFQEIFRDFLNTSFNLDSRLLRTLIPLFVQPGKLTTEFFAGRRIRYISPTRLYFISSFFFFLLLSLIGLRMVPSDPLVDIQLDPPEIAPIDPQMAGESPPDPHRVTLGDDERTEPVGAFETAMNTAAHQVAEDPKLLLKKIFDSLPIAIFLLMPFFALILKISYLSSKERYIKHLIFSLQLHALFFLFSTLLLAISPVLPSDLPTLLAIAYLGFYLFAALKRVYGQGYLLTGVKWLLVGGTYSLTLFAASIGLVILNLYLIGRG